MNELHRNDRIESVEDEELNRVSGGLNPQPLPPRVAAVARFGDPYVNVQNLGAALIVLAGG